MKTDIKRKTKKARRGNIDAFQTLMGLSLAHFFGCYNPKQLADYLGIPHQRLYEQLKTLSLYSLKKMLFRFMVHHDGCCVVRIVGIAVAGRRWSMARISSVLC